MVSRHAYRVSFLVVLCMLTLRWHSAPAADAELFPEPPALKPAVKFWTRVYLEVDTDSGLIHDSRYPNVVYEIVRFGNVKDRRVRQHKVKQRKRQWRKILFQWAAQRAEPKRLKGSAGADLAAALGRAPTVADLRAAAGRLRFQLGQKSKFLSGIVRSGAYEREMRSILGTLGVPGDLAYLPHVESSFNTHAYSKYGAAGMWQFMPATGRRYLEVGYVLDERLDPILGTWAAGRLLKDNYALLGTWPLAITAYNHGEAGMRRAVRKLGTTDIVQILEKYDGRAFGFASRNFYAQFLAARKIARSYEQHFGPLRRHEANPVQVVKLPFFAEVKHLQEHLGVAPGVLRELNPALRPPVLRGEKRIPKGYEMRLPKGTVQPDPDTWLSAIPELHRYAEQRRSRYHKVRPGETVSGIARRHRTSIDTIVALNGLRNRNRIYAGQVLELLDNGSRPVAVLSKAAEKPPSHPAPGPTATAKPPRVSTQLAAGTQGPASLPPPARESIWHRIDADRVTVASGETLGHFADWLGVSTHRLRNINNLSRRRVIHAGQRLKLDFSNASPKEFVARRRTFHSQVETDFLSNFRVTGTFEHTLRSGENLWVLAHKIYSVPPWLLHRYNPKTNFRTLAPGSRLKIPLVEPQTTS